MYGDGELDIYNGDTVHDSWVDYDLHINTGKLPDKFINNHNDWD